MPLTFQNSLRQHHMKLWFSQPFLSSFLFSNLTIYGMFMLYSMYLLFIAIFQLFFLSSNLDALN